MDLLEKVVKHFEITKEVAEIEIKQARKDLEELEKILEMGKNRKLSLEEVYQLLSGTNLNKDLFVINYGNNLLATIKEGLVISDNLDLYLSKVDVPPIKITVKELKEYS